MEKIRKSGIYGKIYNKWFGETFIDNSRYLKNLLIITTVILFSVSFITILYLYWNKKLKSKVEERTYELNNLNKELEKQKYEIERSNKLRGKILESILSGIIVFDNNDKIVEYNRSAEEIMGKEIFIDDKWEHLNIEQEYNFLGFQLAKQGKVITGNKQIMPQNGQPYINYSFIPIGEKNEGIILLLNDITEVKKYEEMASYNERMQALGQLSASIAHEIRNPLTSLNTFIDLIPLKIEDIEFRNQLVDISKKEIARINELITQLIDYTKPVKWNPKMFKSNEVIQEVLLLLSNEFNKKNIYIRDTLEEISVYADKNQVKQIILNLLLNSIDAIGDSGEIIIENYIQDKDCFIEIADNGCGIPDEYTDKIYEPFFTLKKLGTGLGLPVTKKLLEKNGGSISIDSEVGKGTKVVVVLPINEGARCKYE